MGSSAPGRPPSTRNDNAGAWAADASVAGWARCRLRRVAEPLRRSEGLAVGDHPTVELTVRR